MVQLKTMAQLHWKTSYAGPLGPWEEEGASRLQEHSIATLGVANGAVPAAYEADGDIRSQVGFSKEDRLRFVRDFLKERLADGLEVLNASAHASCLSPESLLDHASCLSSALEVSRHSFMDNVGISTDLNEMDSSLEKEGPKDPKQKCLEDFAEWLVEESQACLCTEIYRRRRLVDLPAPCSYAVMWSTRAVERSLFSCDPYTSSNAVIVDVVTPLVDEYIKTFHRKITEYETDNLKDQLAERAMSAEALAAFNANLAEESFKYALRHLEEVDVSTAGFTAHISEDLLRWGSKMNASAHASCLSPESLSDHASCPSLGLEVNNGKAEGRSTLRLTNQAPSKLLAAFVAQTAAEAIRLYLAATSSASSWHGCSIDNNQTV